MARDTRCFTAAAGHSELYAMLARREELAARNGGRVETASGQVYDGSPERLARFQQGLPVSLRAWDVPEAVRAEVPKRVVGCRRAVVWPDGAVEIRGATADELLADLDL
ncbi:hypothetical protein [Mycobacterium sp. URHD0025]|uniref:hypothetical protein n=1 Tax=Mycobacterium sp. URHD0025 TaxID=1298864 RepID=UPI0003FB41E9|nr:hypothetical protein [Mycobacterium sp. URHD0025]